MIVQRVWTRTFSAAERPRATSRPSSRQTTAADSGRFSIRSPVGVQIEPALGQVAEERRVLIEHPDDPEVLSAAALRQRNPLGLGQRAVGGRDRVAVGVDGRVAEEVLDPVDQPLGDRVLHVLGLLVNLVPRHFERPGEEQLQEAVASDHHQGQPVAGVGQPGALVRGVGRQRRFGERLEHAGDGPRRDPQRLGNCPVLTAVPAGVRAAIRAIDFT